jgi:hypothetical protein
MGKFSKERMIKEKEYKKFETFIIKEFDEKFGENAPECVFKSWENLDKFKEWLKNKIARIYDKGISDECNRLN